MMKNLNTLDTIDKYFDSLCRIIIKEMNVLSRTVNVEDIKKHFNTYCSENDLVFKLAKAFGSLVRCPTEGSKGKDLIIDSMNFELEVKYWRNWTNTPGARKTIWKQSLVNELNWLCDENSNGNKGKRMIICGWSTVFGWNELLQLGKGTGKNPEVNYDRLHLLPFLNCTNGHLDSVKTQYALKEGTLTVIGKESIVNWRLYGEETDSFNIVMYW